MADPRDRRSGGWPRARDGRHLAPLVQDRDRARARRRKARRRRRAAVGAAAAVRRPTDPGRSDRLFRGGGARDPAADHALSQSGAGRRRVDPRHHRARQAAERAADQGKLARSRPRVAPDRRDRACRACALFHHHADAAREHPARRRRRHHAAAGRRDRAPRDRCVRRRRPRARRRAAAPVRAVSGEIHAPRPRPGDEGGDEPDRHSGRRALSALCVAQPRRDGGARRAAAHHGAGPSLRWTAAATGDRLPGCAGPASISRL